MGLVQKFSLHTHTVGFDGRNTVAEMIARGREIGLGALGISNHFIVHKNIKSAPMFQYAARYGYDNIYSTTFADAIAKFQSHYREIDKLRDQTDIRLLRGLEVDFFPTKKWRDGFARAVEILRPDYIIGSAHFVEHDGTLYNMHDVCAAQSPFQNALIQQYWEKVCNAAASGLFTFMAHIDLPKKVGLGRDGQWADMELAAVRAAAGSNTGIEINTGPNSVEIFEPYPSARILKMISANNVGVLLSDDAHSAQCLCRHFDTARALCDAVGVRWIENIR